MSENNLDKHFRKSFSKTISRTPGFISVLQQLTTISQDVMKEHSNDFERYAQQLLGLCAEKVNVVSDPEVQKEIAKWNSKVAFAFSETRYTDAIKKESESISN